MNFNRILCIILKQVKLAKQQATLNIRILDDIKGMTVKTYFFFFKICYVETYITTIGTLRYNQRCQDAAVSTLLIPFEINAARMLR